MKKALSIVLTCVLMLALATPTLANPDKTGGFTPTEETYGAVAVAAVTKIKGNQNELAITIEIDGAVVAETNVLINNNSAGEFGVGEFFKVYVSTYGNDKIDVCFITYAECVVHDWEDYVVDPTCEDEGYTIGVCQKCGLFTEDKWDFTNPLGHDFDVTDVALFFNEDLGKWVYPCRACGIDDVDNFADLSGVATGGFKAPWDVPGLATVEYTQTAYIEHLTNVPIRSGDDTRKSRLYYPVGEDVPDELPMIVFFHGYELSGYNASRVDYIGQGLARCGFLVVLAGHQASSGGGYFNGYMYNAAAIINGTISYLDGADNTTGINLARDGDGQIQYGFMGYSMGCIVAMNMASNYSGWTYQRYTVNLFMTNTETVVPPVPKPLFVFCLEISNGGGTANNVQTGWPMSTSTYGGYWANLDPDIYVVMTTGSGLSTADKNHALAFWNAIGNHPEDHKQFIGWNSDFKPGGTNTTQPARLDAVHYWPSAWPATSATGNGPALGNNLNALHYAMFRVANSMANTAFYGTDYDNWYDYDFMGIWWDGTPINPATISHEAGLPANDYWN